MKSLPIYLTLYFLIFPGLHCFSQDKPDTASLSQVCLIVYNDINDKGIEEDVTAVGWFSELPYVPNYTYNDPDAGRRVTIRTRTTFYKNEVLYNGANFFIIPGSYGIIKAQCKVSGNEFVILDLHTLQPEFVGLPLTVEVLPNQDGSLLVFESYPFEEDFPFKFEEDVVITKIPVDTLEDRCLGTNENN